MPAIAALLTTTLLLTIQSGRSEVAAAPPAAELEAIAKAREEVRQAGPDLRRAAAEAAIDRRRRLLESRPQDPRRPTWLVDQAEDILLLLLPSDGSDLQLLFGRPSDADRRRSLDLVAEALACLRDAGGEGDRRPRPSLPAPPGADQPPSVPPHQSPREALLRGMALVLQAQRGPEPAGGGRPEAVPSTSTARAGDLEMAAAILSPIALDLDQTGRRVARTFLALALAERKQGDESLRLLSEVLAEGSFAPLDRLRAELASIAIRRRAGDLRGAGRSLTALAAGIEPSDLFARLLVADQQALLQEAVDGSLERAWLPYRALLASATSRERATLRQVTLARTASLVDPSIAAEDLPPFPALAVLVERPQRNGREGLVAFLDREDLPPMERTMAAMALAEVLLTEHEPQAAVELLLTAAGRDRGQPEAIECAERAAELATALWNTQPEDAEARAIARRTYERLLRDFADLPRRDAWRLEAARLALREGRSSAVPEILIEIRPDAPLAAAATLLTIEAKAVEARGAQGGRAFAAWREVVSGLERLSGPVPSAAPGQELLRAEALLGVGEPRAALALLDRTTPSTPQEDAHAWRLTLDALAMDQRDHEVPQRATERARRGLGESTATVLTALLSRLEQECRRLEMAGARADLDRLGRQRMVHLAEGLMAARDDGAGGEGAGGPTPEQARSEQVRSELAWAARGLLRGGRPDAALAIVDRLLARQPDLLDLLTIRAECLVVIGAGTPTNEALLVEAMELLKRIAAGRREARDRAFWLAETLQLEILADLGRNTGQIGPRVEQLRRLDPTLGGEEWRRRLEGAAARVR